MLLWLLGRVWPFDAGVLGSRWVLWPASVVIVGGTALMVASAFVLGHRPICGDGPGLLPR